MLACTVGKTPSAAPSTTFASTPCTFVAAADSGATVQYETQTGFVSELSNGTLGRRIRRITSITKPHVVRFAQESIPI